jgi:hypothetical protein
MATYFDRVVRRVRVRRPEHSRYYLIQLHSICIYEFTEMRGMTCRKRKFGLATETLIRDRERSSTGDA